MLGIVGAAVEEECRLFHSLGTRGLYVGASQPSVVRIVSAVHQRLEVFMLGTILLIVLILLLIGALPSWGYSRGWGYGPSGLLGIVLIVIIVLLLMGRL
jgi:hypothetical protein